MKIFLTAEILATFLFVLALAYDVSHWHDVYDTDGGWTTHYKVPVKVRRLRNTTFVVALGISFFGFLFAIWSY